jgi:hypothetical protein
LHQAALLNVFDFRLHCSKNQELVGQLVGRIKIAVPIFILSATEAKIVLMRKIGFHFLVLCILLSNACSKNSDNGPEFVSVDKTANLKGTGESANDILSNANFDKLTIEIGYVTGFRPTDEAMTNFIEFFLKVRTFKEDIELIYNELPSPGEEKLSLEKIAQLEGDHRTVYNQGSTVAVYIYFADAPAEEDDEDQGLVTLGAVYRNTSMVVHESTVRKFAGKSPFITNADVEVATINHEFGHLFGLVDLGSLEVNPHEDLVSPNHCNVEGCLLSAELQFGVPINKSSLSSDKGAGENGLKAACSLSGKSVLKMLQNSASKVAAVPVPLDAECILDLRANGGR